MTHPDVVMQHPPPKILLHYSESCIKWSPINIDEGKFVSRTIVIQVLFKISSFLTITIVLIDTCFTIQFALESMFPHKNSDHLIQVLLY